MTESSTLEAQDDAQEPQESPERPQDDQEAQESQQEAEETFPREYVEKLRQENGKYRQRAQQADDLARRLHVALVAQTGRLADPEDLPFDEDHLEGEEQLSAAIDALLERKPHLASRRPRGDVGQGRMSDPTGTVDLAALLRSRA